VKTFFGDQTNPIRKKGKSLARTFPFFRYHTNTMRKKWKILVKTFFGEHTIPYLEIFCFEHSGRFFPPLHKLFCSSTSYGYVCNRRYKDVVVVKVSTCHTIDLLEAEEKNPKSEEAEANSEA